jgi:hypothetical protein
MIEARFIGGTGRCGTAVLGSIVNAHPETIYFREPRFICEAGGLADYVHGAVTLEQFRHSMLPDFYRTLIAGLAENGVPAEAIQAVYAWEDVEGVLHDTMTGKDRIQDSRRFILTMFSRFPMPYWVEKTPHTVRYVDLLYQMFGDGLRYVHLIREPKDVLASLMRQRWGPGGVDRFCLWYLKIMGDARAAYEQVPQRCYTVVEMEKMARRPQDVVPALFTFFEIPADPDWLFDAIKTIRPVDAHIGRYTDDLSRSEQQHVNDECGPLYLWWKGKAR